MKIPTELGLSFLERLIACVTLVLALPWLALIALVIQQTAGKPVIISEELPGTHGTSARYRYRFRTVALDGTSMHSVGKFLRLYSVDEIPGLWNVVRGDLGLRDYFRLGA